MFPRDRPRAAVDAARAKTREQVNTMLVRPTGTGKTAIAGFYIGEEVKDTREARVLVLQHAGELIEQNRGVFAKVICLHIGGEISVLDRFPFAWYGDGHALRASGFQVATGLDFGLSKYAANCHLNFRWNRAAITAAVLKDMPLGAA